MTDLVHHLGQKFLPYSRNVFVIILLSFIFRVLLVAILIVAKQFIVLMEVADDSWLDNLSKFFDSSVFVLTLSEPLGRIFNLIFIFTELEHLLSYVYQYILPLPVLWLICCIINRKILVDMPRKTFWFFAACQPYTIYFSYLQMTKNCLTEGKIDSFLINSNNISFFIISIFFPLLCWWGVERMRAKYLSEINE